jgi:RNA-directed DNA polymerase
MDAVLSPANLKQAGRRVKSNHGAPGIDGLRIEDFPAYARDHWPTIRQTLSEGRYQPQPVRRVTIPKPGGGERALGILTVVDRVIQQAIAQIMTPIFDPDFSESSYGFRPGRSAHGALKQIRADLKAGYRIAVDLDLAKFFDNVDHDILMARVARKVSDKRLLALIGRYLRAGVMIGSTLQPSELGTPQGGPLSPLLANILLDDLDRTLEERGHRFARYADDLMVLVKSERAGQRVKASLTAYLDRQLKLPVNEKKSHVAKIEQCVFLGFTFRKNKLRWTDAAFADFKHRLRELTGRSGGWSRGFGRHVARLRNGTGMQARARPARGSMDYRFDKLGQYLRGWMGYFGISEYYRPIPELDEWLRRRVRMCYWKQWRLCRTKISHLLALGVDKWTAIVTGVSGKSYWHLSRSKATQVGMTNDWLRTQGLVSIRDLWMKAHGYA